MLFLLYCMVSAVAALTLQGSSIGSTSATPSKSTASQQPVTATTYNPDEENFWGYVLANKWLKPYCRTQLWSSMSDWERKDEFSTAMDKTANLTTLPGLPSPVSTTIRPSDYSQLYRLTERVADKGSRVFTVTATSPCCGYCYVHGRNITVYLWPTSNNSSSISKRDNLALGGGSKLVDSNGFTFTSPSIYIAFDSIYATNWCGELRGKHPARTMAFQESELSTHKGYQWDKTKYVTFEPFDGFEAAPKVFTYANFGNSKICTQITESFWQYRHIPRTFANLVELSSWSSAHHASVSSANRGQTLTDPHYFTVSYNPCSPSMYLPTGILNTKGWADCSPGLGGFFDPPSTLKPGHGFTTMSSWDNGPASQTTSLAAPGPSPAPNSASVTAMPDRTTAASNTVSLESPPTTVASPTIKETAKASLPSILDGPFPQFSQQLSEGPAPAQLSAPEITPAPISSPSLEATQLISANPLEIVPVSAEVTINGLSSATDSSSAFVIGSQTLYPGNQATVSETLYSLAPAGDYLVIGTRTQTLFDPSSAIYNIGSRTLTPGAAVTVSGTTFGAQPGGLSVTIGSSLGETIATIGGVESKSRDSTGVLSTQAGRNGTYTPAMFRGGSTPVRINSNARIIALMVGLVAFCIMVI